MFGASRPSLPGIAANQLLSMNCLREGHNKKHCTAPTVCNNCGVQGHKAVDCPTPDVAVPHKCYRCGEPGHSMRKCTAPPSCQHCGAKVRHPRPLCVCTQQQPLGYIGPFAQKLRDTEGGSGAKGSGAGGG
ncbi:hypothetical protein C8R46DRAFT_496771 [Mycena filopes]|nr:hypothetical protein C8R46DRAFT_496771 [Mycena filopes]